MSKETPVTPLIKWPNNESIRGTILELIARDQGDTDPDPRWMNLAETTAAVPGIMEAIQAEMDEYRMPQALMEDLDREQTHMAREVMRKMPAEHRENLIRAFDEKLEE